MRVGLTSAMGFPEAKGLGRGVPGRQERDVAPPAWRFSIFALAGLVATYALMAGTAVGRNADAAVVHRDLDGFWEAPAQALTITLTLPVVTLAVGVLCWIAIRDHRPADALRTVVLVAASVAFSRLLESALETGDPMGIEKARALGPAWYPSGHAAVAMALGLAALLVAPTALRSRGLLLASALWPAMVGWAILANVGHHPSDVAGGILLATAIAGTLSIGRRADERVACELPWRAIGSILAALIAAAGLLAALGPLRVPHSILQPALILPGVVVTAMTFGLLHRFDQVLVGEAAAAGAPSEAERDAPTPGSSL